MHPATPDDTPHEEDSLLGEIICEHGSARIRNQTELTWRNGTDAAVEILTTERSEIEVMLDHFCRRSWCPGSCSQSGRHLSGSELAEPGLDFRLNRPDRGLLNQLRKVPPLFP